MMHEQPSSNLLNLYTKLATLKLLPAMAGE